MKQKSKVDERLFSDTKGKEVLAWTVSWSDRRGYITRTIWAEDRDSALREAAKENHLMHNRMAIEPVMEEK